MGTVSHKGRDERLELRNSNCPFLHTVDTVGNPGQAGNPYIGHEAQKTQDTAGLYKVDLARFVLKSLCPRPEF